MMTAPRDTGDRDAPPDDGASAHAHGSFFGRRKGHKLRIHQADLIDNLLPHLALDIGTPAPARLADLFDGDITDVRLEIGFGGGEHLIAEAQAFPNIGFIGCEPYVNGMAKILTQIEAHNIGNIKLYAGDAAELLAWAPARSLVADRPDPSRSLAEAAALEAALRAGRHGQRDGAHPEGGCEFRFVSDIDDYCAWTLAHLMRSSDFLWTAERAADWRQAVGRLHHDALRPQSRARGARGGVFAVSADGVEAGGFILRDGACAPPQDEVLDPHGEERGKAARLEPRGHAVATDHRFAASSIFAFLASVASHTMRLPRSRPSSSIGS